jgi:DNA polymerase
VTGDPQDELVALARAVRAHVELDATSGVDGYPQQPERPAATAASGAPDAAAEAATAPVPELFGASALHHLETLPALRTHIGDCQRCKLAPHRTNLVFGVGDPKAQLVFVGEAPGADEDARGEPFVGRAGQLLTEIITKGMGLRREDVYIANVIKCRPPGNRNPEPDEVATCEPFLVRQLELIAPHVIVALGKFAVQALLRTKTPITKLRGQWFDYHGIRLMPTFHPAYLLRNPGDKRLVWADIKAVMAELALPVPGR